jgi:hypothetical protein
MKKILLFALFAVVAIGFGTLGGYDKSPTGDPAVLTYVIDGNHYSVAVSTAAYSNDMHSQTACEEYFLPDFIIEEFDPSFTPKYATLDERWCRRDRILCNKASSPTSLRKVLLNPPKLC